MFHLVQSIYHKINEKPEYSVLILGIENSGKTTFLEQLKKKSGMNYKDFNKIMPTMGQNVANIPIQNGRLTQQTESDFNRPTKTDMVLRVWDLSGQTRLRRLWAKYFDKCHAIVYIMDSSFDDIEKENFDRRMESCVEVFEKDVLEILNAHDKNIPILILANKQDKTDVLDIVDLKMAFNRALAKMDHDFDSRILPISATSGEGIDTCINWLVMRLIKNSEFRPPIYK
ncbi:unnamed protein product [Hanseniaspora opuntiae]|jgi:ADP-ribosylation factor related protein 1|uniref:ADP-ribosylation factor-like protein 3 n=1 Tax=Hanseniaspora opuntiae TaxID=211096 RepID=A0A1E5RSQ4_9ASCO|nr:ADP-ribosylation factor-like protein 3 [Hanseniaspora opuntiae]